MSLARATSLLLERAGATEWALLAVLLELPAMPTWADGIDQQGRAVVLVGRHGLGQSEAAQQAVAHVLGELREGMVPPGVHVVVYAPEASRAIAVVVGGAAEQVLLDGPRGSGKTMAVPGALAILAEQHARAGLPFPLRVLWLHDSLRSASEKTGQSLEAELWAGTWRLRDDRGVAAFTLGGVEMVRASFVSAQDAAGSERARAECHTVVGEELCSSMEESAGIPERVWDTARSSMRLPTQRLVAIATTNPGSEESWPYRRFVEGHGRRGCVRVPIPASDRLSAAEVQALRDTFRDAPDLEARLALGTWTGLQMGERVAEGFDPTVHVASERLQPREGLVLACGWDGGHSPSCVIAQLHHGQVQVFASLNALKSGTLELIEDAVRPWLATHAPWATRSLLAHVLDPSMSTSSEASHRESAEKMIREQLGGRIAKGAVQWAPRREAILRVLAPRAERGVSPLLISNAPETRLLREAFAGKWYYAQTMDGRVDRSRPKKPNSPWADVGDAAAYVVGWLRPGQVRPEVDPRRPTQYAVSQSAESWRAYMQRPRGGG